MIAAGKLAIEQAIAADVTALEQIAIECGLEVDFAKELARSYAVLRVARRGAEVCGFLLAWRAADELHLTDLGVTANARRNGIGRALVLDLRRTGESTGARVILLEVRASNVPALALYGSLAFVDLDRRAGYYADTGEDAVVMQLELR